MNTWNYLNIFTNVVPKHTCRRNTQKHPTTFSYRHTQWYPAKHTHTHTDTITRTTQHSHWVPGIAINSWNCPNILTNVVPTHTYTRNTHKLPLTFTYSHAQWFPQTHTHTHYHTHNTAFTLALESALTYKQTWSRHTHTQETHTNTHQLFVTGRQSGVSPNTHTHTHTLSH